MWMSEKDFQLLLAGNPALKVRSFAVVNKPVTETAVFKAQSELIKELAEKEGGVFIGRCADYIMRERRHIRILVYADLKYRLLRCHEKAESGECLSDGDQF